MPKNSISVSLTGEKELYKALTSYKQSVVSTVQQQSNISAVNIENKAKKRAPVDMGRLRSSIRIRFFVNAVTVAYDVFTDVFYALYQELGTGRYAKNGDGRKTPWAYKDPKTGKVIFTHGNKPHPFMFPAYEAERPKFAKRLEAALKRLK